MKTVLKVVGTILICAALLLLILSITGFQPRSCSNIYENWACRFPGLWLRGNVVTAPVTDWSFAENVPTVKLQTHTWYLLPHSVNVGCTYYDGHLYVSSVYMRPDVKYRWNQYVLRDPRVRIKIGNNLYDRTLVYVTDPAEKAAVAEAKQKKYSPVEPLFHGLAASTTTNVFRVPNE